MNLTWAQLKTIIDNSYNFMCDELDSNRYFINTIIDGIEYFTVLWFTDTTNKTQFDDDYKESASTNISDIIY